MSERTYSTNDGEIAREGDRVFQVHRCYSPFGMSFTVVGATLKEVAGGGSIAVADATSVQGVPLPGVWKSFDAALAASRKAASAPTRNP